MLCYSQGLATAVIKIPRYISRYFGSTGVPYRGNLKVMCFYRYRVSKHVFFGIGILKKFKK